MMLSILLFISSSLNANAVVADPYKCMKYADIQANDTACEVQEITGYEYTYSDWYADWTVFYDACMSN
ncbi:MAG: hypothetical protein R2812_01295 [Gelidibacter sp.]